MREEEIIGEDTGEHVFRVDLSWIEHSAAEDYYANAENCLADAMLVAREREYYSLCALIAPALSCVKSLGRIYNVNGQKRLAVHNG